jgi:DNA polymerase-3 subunit epsilon
MKKFIALDTETTGFHPGQICQLSYVVFTDEGITKAFNKFFTVDEVDAGAEKIHGLSVEKLKELSEGKTFKDCAEEVLADLQEADEIFIHNSDFDIKFVLAELGRCDLEFDFNGKTCCTMKDHTEIIRLPGRNGGFKWPKLSETMEFYKINPDKTLEETKRIFECEESGFHDSRFDVAGLYHLVINMRNAFSTLLNELKEDNQNNEG